MKAHPHDDASNIFYKLGDLQEQEDVDATDIVNTLVHVHTLKLLYSYCTYMNIKIICMYNLVFVTSCMNCCFLVGVPTNG